MGSAWCVKASSPSTSQQDPLKILTPCKKTWAAKGWWMGNAWKSLLLSGACKPLLSSWDQGKSPSPLTLVPSPIPHLLHPSRPPLSLRWGHLPETGHRFRRGTGQPDLIRKMIWSLVQEPCLHSRVPKEANFTGVWTKEEDDRDCTEWGKLDQAAGPASTMGHLWQCLRVACSEMTYGIMLPAFCNLWLQ